MTYQVGQRVNGVVTQVSAQQLIIKLAQGGSGKVASSDFGDNWGREQRRYQPGQPVRVVVLHHHQGRLDLSLTQANAPELVDPTNPFNQVTPAQFEPVLAKTVADAKAKLRHLEAVLAE